MLKSYSTLLCLLTNCDITQNAMPCSCVLHCFKRIIIVMIRMIVILRIIKILIMVIIISLLKENYAVQLSVKKLIDVQMVW